MAEIKKVTSDNASYPKAGFALKLGVAAAAAGIIAGCMTGCGPMISGDVQYVAPTETVTLSGDVAYVEPEDAGDVTEYVPDDEPVSGTDCTVSSGDCVAE